MRTQAHRIDDTDPKRGNVVVRVTGTRHDEPTYQVRQSLPNTQEVPGHDHHTNRVRETGSGSHGPILRSVPTNRLTAPGPILGVPSLGKAPALFDPRTVVSRNRYDATTSRSLYD